MGRAMEEDLRDKLVDELITLADHLGLAQAVSILREAAEKEAPSPTPPLSGKRVSAFGPNEEGDFHM